MGLEVVVRPVVFPNIRPAPPRVLPPLDDPTQGFATISGSGGRLIDLPHSFSVSISHQRPHKETKRQFDKERIYQVDADGNINRKNYVDVERMTRVLAKSQSQDDPPVKIEFAKPPERDNVETLESDVTRTSPG